MHRVTSDVFATNGCFLIFIAGGGDCLKKAENLNVQAEESYSLNYYAYKKTESTIIVVNQVTRNYMWLTPGY